MELILQYIFSLVVLAAVLFGLGALKSGLFRLSARLSESALRRGQE